MFLKAFLNGFQGLQCHFVVGRLLSNGVVIFFDTANDGLQRGGEIQNTFGTVLQLLLFGHGPQFRHDVHEHGDDQHFVGFFVQIGEGITVLVKGVGEKFDVLFGSTTTGETQHSGNHGLIDDGMGG